VWLTHPLLPLFRRRALRGNPLIPLFLRRAPGDDHLLPLFRRRGPSVDATRMSKCHLDSTLAKRCGQMTAKVTTTKQQRQKPDDKSLTTKLEASTHLR